MVDGNKKANLAKIKLEYFIKQMRQEIEKKHGTTDKFCLEAEIDRSMIYRLFSGDKPDIKVSTLCRIAIGLKKRLVIELR